VNITKYKQYAINIKQQLQINTHSTHSNWKKTLKVHKLGYRFCIVGLDIPGTRIDQSIGLL